MTKLFSAFSPSIWTDNRSKLCFRSFNWDDRASDNALLLARKSLRRDVRAVIISLLVKEFPSNDWQRQKARLRSITTCVRSLGDTSAERIDGDKGLPLGRVIICIIM